MIFEKIPPHATLIKDVDPADILRHVQHLVETMNLSFDEATTILRLTEQATQTRHIIFAADCADEHANGIVCVLEALQGSVDRLADALEEQITA